MSGKVASKGSGIHPTVLRPTAKALPADSRAHNRSLVLRALFHDGPTSRAAMARQTGLTRVSISELVAGLIAEGLAEDLGALEEGRVGKPAMQVALSKTAPGIIAVDLSDTDIARGAVMSMTGEVSHRVTRSMTGAHGQQVVDQVTHLVAGLLEAAGGRVLGIGIASPGVVAPGGVVRTAPNYGWDNVPLAADLTERFQRPCHVGNDANLAALAEFTFGGAGSDGMMLVTVGRGLGAGILLDGVLLQGHSFAAGE
jgi:hypothetical protein